MTGLAVAVLWLCQETIILGDDDGVTVVPLERADAVLEASLARMAYEEDILNKLASGADVSGLFPSPELEIMS